MRGACAGMRRVVRTRGPGPGIGWHCGSCPNECWETHARTTSFACGMSGKAPSRRAWRFASGGRCAGLLAGPRRGDQARRVVWRQCDERGRNRRRESGRDRRHRPGAQMKQRANRAIQLRAPARVAVRRIGSAGLRGGPGHLLVRGGQQRQMDVTEGQHDLQRHRDQREACCKIPVRSKPAHLVRLSSARMRGTAWSGRTMPVNPGK